MRAQTYLRTPELAVGAFGEKLRKQRERRGLALDAISNTTKISTRMLRALEDEHFDQLPGGVFNKGFVRAYARQVGLDEEETVSDYLTALRESQVQSQKILPDFRSPGAKPGPITPTDSRHHVLAASDHPRGDGPDNDSQNPAETERRRNEDRRNEVRRTQDRAQHHGAPALVDSAKSTQIAAAVRNNGSPDAQTVVKKPRTLKGAQPDSQFEKHHRDDPHASTSLAGFITPADGVERCDVPEESLETSQSGVSKSMVAAAALLLLILVGLALWNARRNRNEAAEPVGNAVSSPQPISSAPMQPAMTQTSAAVATTKLAPASSSEKAPVAKSSAPALGPSTKSSPVSPAPKPAATSLNADSRAMKSAASTPAAKPLPTFTLMIRADQTTWISIIADGKPEMHETLIAPAHTSVRAARDVTVKVGNAGGVSFQLNGKEFPAQGNAGEVKSYVFDATGLRP